MGMQMSACRAYTTSRYKHYSSYIKNLPRQLIQNKYLYQIVVPLSMESSHIIYQTMNNFILINPFVHSGTHIITLGFLFRGVCELYDTTLPPEYKEATINDAIFITRFVIVILSLYYTGEYIYDEYYSDPPTNYLID